MAAARKIRNLNDLAERVGCTATAVSMALRDSPQLSAGLREKIKRTALENDFAPRSYSKRKTVKEKKRYSHLGPLLLLHNDYYNELNPARDQTMPHAFQLLNQYGVEYAYLDVSEVRDKPERFREFAGVLYYNDQEIGIPEELPAMQIFGWTPLKPRQDRITVDDVKIAELSVQFFLNAGVKRVVTVWREDMIQDFYQHPRIKVLENELNGRGIPVTPILFDRQDTDFPDRLRSYIGSGDSSIGFFAFNAVSGLKLCSVLDIMHLMPVYAPDKLLVCDNDSILQNFWPRFHIIDLDFPMLARRAVDGLLWRLEHPDSPEAVTFQRPRLISPQNEKHSKKGI